jgi:hypothetical protein
MLFVQVNSVEKQCPVIVNLDHISEIAPLKAGGCAIFFADAAGAGAKSSMTVSDDYSLFKQFVMETVSSEQIAKQVENLKATNGPKQKIKVQLNPNDPV